MQKRRLVHGRNDGRGYRPAHNCDVPFEKVVLRAERGHYRIGIVQGGCPRMNVRAGLAPDLEGERNRITCKPYYASCCIDYAHICDVCIVHLHDNVIDMNASRFGRGTTIKNICDHKMPAFALDRGTDATYCTRLAEF